MTAADALSHDDSALLWSLACDCPLNQEILDPRTSNGRRAQPAEGATAPLGAPPHRGVWGSPPGKYRGAGGTRTRDRGIMSPLL